MENTNKPSSTSLLVGSHTSKPFAKWWAFPKMGPLIAEWAILYRQLCHGIVRNHGLPKLSYCHDMSWVQICSTDPLFKDRSDREWIVSWKTCPYIRELQCNTAIDFAVIPCYTLGFCQKKTSHLHRCTWSGLKLTMPLVLCISAEVWPVDQGMVGENDERPTISFLGLPRS